MIFLTCPEVHVWLKLILDKEK